MGVSAAVTGVYFPLGTQEKDHQCQVVIKLEQVEVDAVEARQPDANELIGEVLDAFETDNLPVKLATGDSRVAPQDDHERLAALAPLGLTLVETKNPAVPQRFRIQDQMAGATGLGTHATAAPTNEQESHDTNDSTLHETSLKGFHQDITVG
jgi:hypothetical protein